METTVQFAVWYSVEYGLIVSFYLCVSESAVAGLCEFVGKLKPFCIICNWCNLYKVAADRRCVSILEQLNQNVFCFCVYC